jgi:hypothetical protein
VNFIKLWNLIMNKPKNLYRDVATGVLFTVGMFGFLSGAFMFSTLVFGAASVASNLDFVSSSKNDASVLN